MGWFWQILGEIKFRICWSLFSSHDSKVITLVMGMLMAGVNTLNESAMDGISRSSFTFCFLMSERVVAVRRGLWCRYKMTIWEAIWWSLRKSCIVLSGVVCWASVTIVLTIIGVRERACYGEGVRANRVAFGIWRWPFCRWIFLNWSITSMNPFRNSSISVTSCGNGIWAWNVILISLTVWANSKISAGWVDWLKLI